MPIPACFLPAGRLLLLRHPNAELLELRMALLAQVELGPAARFVWLLAPAERLRRLQSLEWFDAQWSGVAVEPSEVFRSEVAVAPGARRPWRVPVGRSGE